MYISRIAWALNFNIVPSFFISGDFRAVCNTMKDLLEELKRLIIRIVSIQNLICLAKSNNTTYQMGSRNIKIFSCWMSSIFSPSFIFQLHYLCKTRGRLWLCWMAGSLLFVNDVGLKLSLYFHVDVDWRLIIQWTMDQLALDMCWSAMWSCKCYKWSHSSCRKCGIAKSLPGIYRGRWSKWWKEDCE